MIYLNKIKFKQGLFLIIFFLAFAVSIPALASNLSLFDQAGAKYREGDFKKASDLYQKVIQSGRGTGAVYYNLGNCALKLGNKGHAMVYYLRALKTLPRDKDLRWNIHVLTEALPDRIDDSSYFAVAALRNLISYCTANELAVSFSIFLSFLVFFNLLPVFFTPVRSWARWVSAFFTICLIMTIPFFGWKLWELKDPRAVVLDKQTYAYYGPSDSETKAFLLHEGASGKIIDTTDEWFYLSLPNKKMGWIRKNSCEIV